jgi:protein phosphatase
MGSRAVAVVCRDEQTAASRFGIADSGIGAIYTRTGRPFFSDAELEQQILSRLATALSAADFWNTFSTSWICLDAELMPWSAKARQLLRDQYAAVGSAATTALADVTTALARANARDGATSDLLALFESRDDSAARFVSAYRNYCWSVDDLTDLKLAPFHILATERAVHTDRDHRWHMDQLASLCARDPDLLVATPYKLIDVTNPDSVAEGVAWWTELTDNGGEGIVIKPLDWIVRGERGLVQPAIKCRGREYLRIIYGPTYTEPDNLARLRRRGLSTKRSLALREFALGLEALHRFVDREPLYRVHECVFGVLALESEPVDPRL